MTIVLTYDIVIRRWRYAGVAQLVEQLICNQQVRGSSPFTSSNMEEFPSGQREQTVNLSLFSFGGSNPPSSTTSSQAIYRLWRFFYIIFKNRHGTHTAAPPFPQKAHAFRGPRYLFLFLYKQSGFGPLMGANAEACEARSDRETVRWTVSTLVQRCEAPAIKSTLFHQIKTNHFCDWFLFLYKQNRHGTHTAAPPFPPN